MICFNMVSHDIVYLRGVNNLLNPFYHLFCEGPINSIDEGRFFVDD